MTKKIEYDYDSELDIFHVYSEDIKEGVKGCMSIGDFNIDVGNDNKIIGIELEQASKNLNIPSKVLSSLDNVNLIVRKSGNTLFMGIGVIKGTIKSFTHVTAPSNQISIQTAR